MADNQNKNQNQNKGQVSQKPQRTQESEGTRQQSGNRPGQGGMSKDLDKDIGSEHRQVQKNLDTDETDEGQDTDEQNEVTQRSPRQGDDQSRR